MSTQTENFDGVTAPALPTTMAFDAALATAANASTYGTSNPNTLTLAATGGSNQAFATYKTADPGSGNVQVSGAFSSSGSSGAVGWGLTARASATSIATASGTYYWTWLDVDSLVLNLLKVVSGSPTSLNTLFVTSVTLPDIYTIFFNVIGTSLGVQVIRSDSYQLRSDGVWAIGSYIALGAIDSTIAPGSGQFWGCTLQNHADTAVTADTLTATNASAPPSVRPSVLVAGVPYQYLPAWQF